MKRIIATIAVAVLGVLSVAACEPETADTVQQAAESRNRAIDQIRKTQPVTGMTYSSTLETINKWAERWSDRSRLSYVYMQRSDGSFAGYYVLKGLPVSYCTSGSPTFDYVDIKGDGNSYDVRVDAPGLDGAYYGGCDASRYYGFDATTDAYLEYTDGMVLTAVLSDQPLPLSNQPLGPTSVEDVRNSR